MTDDPVATRFVIDEDGQPVEIGFQDYFVARRHSVAVRSVRFAGVEAAAPAAGVLEAIAAADVVIVAPSNPIVSVGPVLAVPGVRDALVARRASVVAVSPIIAGAALKGPADRLLVELGHESSVVGVARIYADVAAALVVDDADAGSAADVEAAGLRCVVGPTIMHGPEEAAALSSLALGAVATGRADERRDGRSAMSRMQMFGLEGIGEIRSGDVLADVIVEATAAGGDDTACATATCWSSPRRSCRRPRG